MLLLLLPFYSHLHLLLSDSKFIQFTNHHIRVEVTTKRVNRAVGLGLKIPVKYFYRDARVITEVKNNLEKLDNELYVTVRKCFK